MALSSTGHEFRTQLAEAGIEVTPDQLVEAIEEAAGRIGYGQCVHCGRADQELRYGWCFDCVIGD